MQLNFSAVQPHKVFAVSLPAEAAPQIGNWKLAIEK